MKKKPVIAITMGDPGGIGPEIILKPLKSFKRDPNHYLKNLGKEKPSPV